jgi:DNA-directed RNA polymerase subunit RPC12/RpoP
MNCPKCRRMQHYCCRNRKCQCWRRVRKNQKPLRALNGSDVIACPYCGFKAHIDYWGDREMQQFYRANPERLAEVRARAAGKE